MNKKIQSLPYSILIDHFRQLSLFLELESEQVKKIVVGEEGGLAYTLFQDGEGAIKNLTITAKKDILPATEYLNRMENYLKLAEEHTKNFGFELVAAYDFGSKKRIFSWDHFNSPFAAAGIGDWGIESLEKAEKFLVMIKENRGRLNQLYHKVVMYSKPDQ